MELLLNLVWLGVALTLVCGWMRRPEHARTRPHLIALLCLLALLFPVISATDDLHAMRSEMEDSTASKRSLKQVATGKLSAHQGIHHPPATLVAAFDPLPRVDLATTVRPTLVILLASRLGTVQSDRAPPIA